MPYCLADKLNTAHLDAASLLEHEGRFLLLPTAPDMLKEAFVKLPAMSSSPSEELHQGEGLL